MLVGFPLIFLLRGSSTTGEFCVWRSCFVFGDLTQHISSCYVSLSTTDTSSAFDTSTGRYVGMTLLIAVFSGELLHVN